MTYFRGKRLLVTGAAGLIGSNLLRRLLHEGATLRATLHHRNPVVLDEKIDYVRCDLTSKENCERVVDQIDHVFHCADYGGGIGSTTTLPTAGVTASLLINTQMLSAAYAANIEKFVWLSSTVAYPFSDKPVKESQMFQGDPFEKYFYIGWAKRFTEILCRMYGEKLPRKMTTIVLRPTYVYGPSDNFDLATSRVIPALIRKSVERWNPFEVWGDGREVRDAIYIDDMVEAMVLAAHRLDSYATINIGLGKGYSVREILQVILELDGFTDANIMYDASKPTMIPLRLIDTSLAENRLGFKAKTDLREGLRKTIAWYRSSRGLAADTTDRNVNS